MKEPPFIGAPSLREMIWCSVGGFAILVAIVLYETWNL